MTGYRVWGMGYGRTGGGGWGFGLTIPHTRYPTPGSGSRTITPYATTQLRLN